MSSSKALAKVPKDSGAGPGGAFSKAQHAIVYDACTSEIKDDIPQLLAVMRTGHGGLTRQEAAFLVWYHAMDDYDKQEELLGAGVIGICLSLLDPNHADVSPAERTCVAGILTAMCEEADLREPIARSKAGQITTNTMLHILLQDERGSMQMYATRCLRLLAEDAKAQAVLLRATDNHLLYASLYNHTLEHNQTAHVLSHLIAYLTAVLKLREDLKDEAIDSGLLESLMTVTRTQKADSVVAGTLKLLLCLAEGNAVSSRRIAALGGVRVLVDLLGAPPASILASERQQYPELLDPHWAERQAMARQEEQRVVQEAEDAIRAAAEAAKSISPRVSEKSRSFTQTSRRPPQAGELVTSNSRAVRNSSGASVAVSTLLTSSTAQLDNMPTAIVDNPSNVSSAAQLTVPNLSIPAAKTDTATQKAAQLHARTVRKSMVDVDTTKLLSISSVALKWDSLATLQTRCLAAGCLYAMMGLDINFMHEMTPHLAANRLVPLLLQTLETNANTGKKKSKSKGLALTSEQAQMLVYITGCLKFLSLANINKYRIAAMGSVKHLVQLYKECSQILIHRNAHVILGNLATLAENGQLLLDGQLPDEFLVPHPLRLLPVEVDQLLREFPEATIGTKSNKTGRSESDSSEQVINSLSQAKV